MDYLAETISHRRRVGFGKKWLILDRSTSVHLSRLRHFFLEVSATLDCDRFGDEFSSTRDFVGGDASM